MVDLFSDNQLPEHEKMGRENGGSGVVNSQRIALNAGNGGQTAEDVIAFIELFFFAYRDFVRDPDSILGEFGFGRAHHRVLHFVCRHPGIRVARLLRILNITKQSLSRVLRQLVEEGYVEQRAGESDRRERRLFPTEEGRALFERLIAPQRQRVAAALKAAAGGEGALEPAAVEQFLLAMIGEPERSDVIELIRAGDDVGFHTPEHDRPE